MKTLVFTPFGAVSQEAGVIYLVANYLKSLYPDVSQLTCNGVVSLCDRDAENGWARSFMGCTSCAGEQRTLARWAALETVALSSFLNPDDIWESQRWISRLSTGELLTAAFEGVRIYELCAASVQSRFGALAPDLGNAGQEQFVRRIMLAALRVTLASRRVHLKIRPDLTLVSGGSDFMTRSYIQQAEMQRRDVVMFRWEVGTRAVLIRRSGSSQVYHCDFIFDDVTSMRPEIESWPPEILSSVHGALGFLGISQKQLKLALAR